MAFDPESESLQQLFCSLKSKSAECANGILEQYKIAAADAFSLDELPEKTQKLMATSIQVAIDDLTFDPR